MKKIPVVLRMFVLSFFVVVNVPANAGAESYGWDAYSFDWPAFQQHIAVLKQKHQERTHHFSFFYQIVSRGQTTRSNGDYKLLLKRAKALQSGSDPARVSSEKKDLFSLMLLGLVVDNPEPELKVKDFSSIYYSSFNSSMFYTIFKKQSNNGQKSWFAMFKAGRSWGQKLANTICATKPDLLIKYQYPWGYCVGAYFVLSPDEAQEFAHEVQSLKTNNAPWKSSSINKEITDLAQILDEASKDGSGLLFLGRVFN